MGSLVIDSTKRDLGDGRKAVFELWAYTDDLDQDGEYSCSIKVTDRQGKMVESYARPFPINKFHDRHYRAFINKFVREPDYRNQFRVTD